MKGTVRYIALLVAIGFIATGCQTMTGRTAGRWVEDKAISAKVKTKLAAADPISVTRVNVDTLDGTVYLTGMVRSEQERQELLDMATHATGVNRVVSHLQVAGEPTAAASPSSGTR